jgi:tetratricopeptide (TPR) repeat protein
MSRLLQLTMLLIVLAEAPAIASGECFQNKEPQLSIKGCSEIIQRDPNDVTAYHNRAIAYGLTGDIDRAIADYTKAIEIGPNNAAAYEHRGRAYASKGDYTKALADVMKASELVAKAAAQPSTVTPKLANTSVTAPQAPKTGAVSPKPQNAHAPSPSSAAKERSRSDWHARLMKWSLN